MTTFKDVPPLEAGLIHCMPTGDFREHIDDLACWCKPTACADEPRVVVHHSMDRREEYENGRKPS